MTSCPDMRHPRQRPRRRAPSVHQRVRRRDGRAHARAWRRLPGEPVAGFKPTGEGMPGLPNGATMSSASPIKKIGDREAIHRIPHLPRPTLQRPVAHRVLRGHHHHPGSEGSAGCVREDALALSSAIGAQFELPELIVFSSRRTFIVEQIRDQGAPPEALQGEAGGGDQTPIPKRRRKRLRKSRVPSHRRSRARRAARAPWRPRSRGRVSSERRSAASYLRSPAR